MQNEWQCSIDLECVCLLLSKKTSFEEAKKYVFPDNMISI